MWEKRQKKTIYTLNVDNYAPEITALTYPLIENYADKIGADFHHITERKFPEWPVTYEKLQIFELAQKHENDWNIYIDSDTLVHPDCPDLTEILPRDTVAHFGKDVSPVRWRHDRFFQRDGRNFGSGNWLAVASDLCIELWKPFDDLTPEEAIANITPTIFEQVSGVVNRSHLIDDYALSRNIAKYGLKARIFREIFTEMGYKDGGAFFYHHYLFNAQKKVVEMKKVLRNWQVVELFGYDFPETPVDKAEKIPGWMQREELEWLFEQAQTMESIVEIGSFKGRSTFALCSGVSGNGNGRVYAIDPFTGVALEANPMASGKPTFQDFMQNCGHFKNLTVIPKTSIEAASSEAVPPQVDMVFIDGDHSYEGLMTDLKAWSGRTKKLICGHDLDDPIYPGVRQALQAYFGADRIKKCPGSIWAIQ
jgi:hypothetical protein